MILKFVEMSRMHLDSYSSSGDTHWCELLGFETLNVTLVAKCGHFF